MSLLFFYFAAAIFLFTLANFVVSPSRNPRFDKLFESKYAPSEDTLVLFQGVCNVFALILTLALIILVPFFQIVTGVLMLAFVACFFYMREVKEIDEAFSASAGSVDEAVEEQLRKVRDGTATPPS